MEVNIASVLGGTLRTVEVPDDSENPKKDAVQLCLNNGIYIKRSIEAELAAE